MEDLIIKNHSILQYLQLLFFTITSLIKWITPKRKKPSKRGLNLYQKNLYYYFRSLKTCPSEVVRKYTPLLQDEEFIG
jgi:hypothetical protein